MRQFLVILAAILLGVGSGQSRADDPGERDKMTSPLDCKLNGIDGKELDLAQFKGKVVLLVNVASECGYTPQYKGLQDLYQRYGDLGLVVIGVPSNDFGKQEPESNPRILEFCKATYKVTFPLTEKVVIKGQKKVPLYRFLTAKESNPEFAGEIGWNFEKFLINRKGQVIGRFKSGVEPTSEEIVAAIKKALSAK